MIIRAVSDDEDDGDDQQHLAGSVFGAGPPSATPRERTYCTLLHSAKIVWIGATLALVMLLLVDLAAIMSHFQRQLGDPSFTNPSAARDPFAFIPALLDAWVSSSNSNSNEANRSILGSVFAGSPALALNNLLGYLGFTAWIFSRETSAQVTRSRVAAAGSFQATAFLWTLIAGVFSFGHVVSCAYILLALFESNGDRSKFFLGNGARVSQRTYPRV